MVFPSLPIFLDPPNWSQQQAEISIQNFQTPPPPQLSPPTTITAAIVVRGGSYEGSIRPGSMVDRARLAKIHQPDAAPKCPRCESTNTKFCYYNNYSLSQPRHFCKTCRRYWTRGGALRNVPVGGGCRRNNKRSKGSSSSNRSSSKSPMKAAGSSSASANSNSSSGGCTNSTDVMAHFSTPAPPTHFSFLPTLHHNSYSDYISGGTGLHFGTFPASFEVRNGNNNTSAVGTSSDAEFLIGTTSLGANNNGGSLLSNGLSEQWKLSNLQQVHVHQQQLPDFMANLEPQIGFFKFGGENAEPPSYVRDGGIRFCSNKALDSSVSGIIIPQPNTPKIEENQGLMSLSKNVLGNNSNAGNDIFWSGSGNNNAWSEVPSFPSSTKHML
ncbi:hypothetical protein RIF29_14074 [Crotalaria pallida]|uniref:Dof zinc finger protein n=1 Tax=Crotalaria pallida TaxID=3830 RepID=A0AAN9FGU6_CROPI